MNSLIGRVVAAAEAQGCQLSFQGAVLGAGQQGSAALPAGSGAADEAGEEVPAPAELAQPGSWMPRNTIVRDVLKELQPGTGAAGAGAVAANGGKAPAGLAAAGAQPSPPAHSRARHQAR
jgi:hypothetical protein